jgi:hypothetical protein
MSFKNEYPEYSTIEEHIRRARAERSVAVAHFLAGIVVAAGRGLASLVRSLGDGLQAEHERRMIEADSFLKRWVPHR